MRLTFALFALLTLAAPARAGIDGDEFSSASWRVRITAPKNWQLTEKTSYPNILLWMARRNPDGRMLLSAERVAAGTDSITYANETSELLTAQGFSVRSPQLHAATGAYIIDFERDGDYLRQALLVAGEIGYSLTLSADSSRTRSKHLRAFDHALRSIRIIRSREESPKS